MQMISISQVSREFDISTRTLRYYEQIGLLQSGRADGSAYRVYDHDTIARLRQILVLRKLRIPLRQISEILLRQDARAAIEVFEQNIAQMDEQIGALQAVRAALQQLLGHIRLPESKTAELSALSDPQLLQLVLRLPPEMPGMKEEYRMKNLNQAEKALNGLKDVRVLHLPKMTVAASHFIGPEPEGEAMRPLLAWARAVDLLSIKPDTRLLGFNHPNPGPQSPVYGYEFWLSVPDDMPVPAPMTKIQFEGGLYAAHMIQMGNFNEWAHLMDWAQHSEGYAPNTTPDGGERMFGLIEEILNLPRHFENDGVPDEHTQLDLLLPIQER